MHGLLHHKYIDFYNSLQYTFFIFPDIKGLGAKLCVAFLFNETESKMKIRIIRRIIWRRALCFSSYKIKLKVKSKTVMSCCSQKKKEGIFCIVYFVRRKCLVSQCLV